MRPPLVNVAVHQSSSSSIGARGATTGIVGAGLSTHKSATVDFHKNGLPFLHHPTQRTTTSSKSFETNGLLRGHTTSSSSSSSRSSDHLANNLVLNSIGDAKRLASSYGGAKSTTAILTRNDCVNSSVQSQLICNDNSIAYDTGSSSVYNECRRRCDSSGGGGVVINSNVGHHQPLYFSRSVDDDTDVDNDCCDDVLYGDQDKDHCRDHINVSQCDDDDDDFISSFTNFQQSDINAVLSDNRLWHYSCDNRGSYVVPIDNSYAQRHASSASSVKQIQQQQYDDDTVASAADDNREFLAIGSRRKRRSCATANQRRSLQFETIESQRKQQTETETFDQRTVSCYVPLLCSTVSEEEDSVGQSATTSRYENYKSETIKAIDEYYNLACSKRNQSANGLHASAAALLDKSAIIAPTIQPQIHQQQRRSRKSAVVRPPSLLFNSSAAGSVVDHHYSPAISAGKSTTTATTTTANAASLTHGGSAPTPPKYSRFEQLIKNLVGRKVSRDSTVSTATASVTGTTTTAVPTIPSPVEFFSAAASKASDHLFSGGPTAFSGGDRLGASTSSLNSLHQKIWNVVPLLRRETSCSSLNQSISSGSFQQRPTTIGGCSRSIKKCETVLALSSGSSDNLVEPIKAQNRLRNSLSTTTCSRCSSLLSLAAASGSRYSLNISHGKFVPIGSAIAFGGCNDGGTSADVIGERQDGFSSTPSPVGCTFMCKLCLGEVTAEKSTKITQCNCLFCTEVSQCFM